jgi:ABC-2 type transport system permease protein
MTLIGTLLTALVIAREWERGTMEAMMATPISITDILMGKLVPYFVLGMGSMLLCTAVAIFLYDVPFRGTLPALLAASSVFLVAALGQGLLISSLAKDQFVASQMALMSAFLPAFMLSGFIYEISAMPAPIQALSHVITARYLVTSLQTIFLTGDIWPLLLSSMGAMAIIGMAFFLLIARKTRKRLD